MLLSPSGPAARCRTAALALAAIVVALLAYNPIAAAVDTDAVPADALEELKQSLLEKLEMPMAEGRNVETALTCWFEIENKTGALSEGEKADLYRKAIASLEDPQPLPQAQWPANPRNVTWQFLETVKVKDHDAVDCRIVAFMVDGLQQYGVVFRPQVSGTYPLILYLHGAAFGVPYYSILWLAELAAEGYVVAAPALRGEGLFTGIQKPDIGDKYVCEGNIENLKGEVNDALGMVDAAYRQDFVAPGKFGIIGHSFGAGVGLLTAARSDKVACVVSYDAWLTNPFRYYWDRLREGDNTWLSWEEYCDQPVADQLKGLMERSIVHHTERLTAPLLLFIGGAYDGSVFHQTHDYFVSLLTANDKVFDFEVVPEGGHNFVLYYSSAPAEYAFTIQMEWLKKHLPPASVNADNASGN